jgi:Leucine-rich repeat (LRR) protein
MKTLQKLSEIPQLRDSINRIIQEKHGVIGLFYVYVMDRRVIGFGFHKTDLKLIPEPVFNFEALKNLYIENNSLTEIPDSILGLKILRELYVCSNRIRTVSESINQLDLLEILDFFFSFCTIKQTN